MGMRISTNVTALRSQQILEGTKRKMDQAMSQISSGNRVNRASDDAVGLAISEGFKSQLRGLKQSHRNAMDGVSMIQIAEGALGEVSNMLIRLRELGLQSASDTLGDRERSMVDAEYQNILEEIDRVAATTEFNGTKLLSGKSGKIDFQINTRNSDRMDRISYNASEADISTTTLGLKTQRVSDKLSARSSLTAVDSALNKINSLRANLGAMQSRLNSTVENILESVENVSTANSRIRDADIAEQSAELAKQNVLMQSGTAILSQANQQGNLAMSLLKQG